MVPGNGFTDHTGPSSDVQTVSLFADLRIACGHFTGSQHEDQNVEQIVLPGRFGALDANKNFVAQASGDSMDGGDEPARDGDYLLLALQVDRSVERHDGETVVVQRDNASGDDEYVLRKVRRTGQGQYEFAASNPKYSPIPVGDNDKVIARLVQVLAPVDVYTHQTIFRKDIPPLFGFEYSRAVWDTGHVRPKGGMKQILLVTLNKRGKVESQRYHDYFIDRMTFHWQSQASTTERGSKGQAIIHHERNGEEVHLFVRRHPLEGGKAAPFIYCGRLLYKSHTGEKPMNVIWRMETPAPSELLPENANDN